MNQINKQVIYDYFKLEEELRTITNYIYLDYENYKTYSFQNAKFLVNCCNSLISFLKAVRHDSSFDQINGIENLREKKNVNITSFHNLLCTELKMNEKKVWSLKQQKRSRVLPNNKRIPIYNSFSPFVYWEKEGSLGKFWRTYNDMKHDLYTKYKHAYFKYILDALSTFFLLLCISIPTRLELVDQGFALSTTRNKNTIKQALKNFEPINRTVNISKAVIQTDFFGYIFDFEPSPQENRNEKFKEKFEENDAGIYFGLTGYWIGL